ncbi:MAG: PD40 domain-containing protein, partial [Amphiplicatus sp.]|nr:PD40 domain-containing protein [Amphiplicatus sp.]
MGARTLRTISFVCSIAACVFAASATYADTTPSVAEVLSFPHASQLTSANGRIAWIVEQGGARSVWTASNPDFEARRVVDFAEDDGKRLSELSLSSDGDYLAFARNSDPLRGGAAPNASDLPTGDFEEIWAGPVSSTPRLVANGTDPVLDPHARRLVFSNQGVLYSIDPAKKHAAPEAILSLRGAVHSPAFSPDGTKLAFVRDLGALSYVGVYDFASRAIKWMAPDFSRDMLPAWSPNGRSIAFIRRAGREFDDDSDVMLTPWAFSVTIADAETGEGRTVWTS